MSWTEENQGASVRGCGYVRPMDRPPRRLDAVVFDLDGVIRHYDRVHERDIEERHGIPVGSLVPTAFGSSAGHEFMCGRLDHDGFAAALSALIGSEAAAVEFVAMRAEVDAEAVALVRSVQAVVPVALLTNGSLRTRSELAEAGLHEAFDHVFNSAETGIPKPLPESYLNVVAALDVDPTTTAFVDDLDVNVRGAVTAGLVGHVYTGLAVLRSFLDVHGIVAS